METIGTIQHNGRQTKVFAPKGTKMSTVEVAVKKAIGTREDVAQANVLNNQVTLISDSEAQIRQRIAEAD